MLPGAKLFANGHITLHEFRLKFDPGLAVVLLLSFCVFSAYALFSQGAFTTDDIVHYQAARYSWVHPRLFIDIWDRPAYTILSSPFAQFGIRAARFFNVLVAVLSCYVAFELAQTLGLSQPWLAASFTAVQPFFVPLASSTLTEPLFCLLLATATLFYVRGHFLRSALCMSLLPLARVEGFVFLLLWLILLARRGERKATASLFLFPILWNMGGFMLAFDPLFLWHYNPYSVLHAWELSWAFYLTRWPIIVGPALLVLIPLGLLYGCNRQRNVIHALIILHFVMLTILQMRGIILPSQEDLRYFVCVAPLLGVLAAEGVHYLFEEMPRLKGQGGRNNLASGFSSPRTQHQILLLLLSVQAILLTWCYFRPGSAVGRLSLVAAWLAVLAGLAVTIRGRDLAKGVLRGGWIVLILAIAVLHMRGWRPLPVSAADRLWSEVARWYSTSSTTRPVIASPLFWLATNQDPFIESACEWPHVVPGAVIVWDSHYWTDPLAFFDLDQFRVIRQWETSDDPAGPLFRGGVAKLRVVVLEWTLAVSCDYPCPKRSN